MPKFTATFHGRKANAIGIFYNIVDTCEGENEEAATLDLYKRYEHIHRLILTPIEDTGKESSGGRQDPDTKNHS